VPGGVTIGGEKINGVRMGRGYIYIYKRVGGKTWCVYEGGKNLTVCPPDAGTRAAAAEPGNEKLTDVHSSRTHR
jgi:hypothetical protein